MIETPYYYNIIIHQSAKNNP